MTQRQLQSQNALCGRQVNPLFDTNIDDAKGMVGVLDDAIPLQDASHADVVEYVVEIPMRYAECFALLSDGRKVGLKNPRRFVGWSRHDRDRSLLFRGRDKHFEVEVEAGLLGKSPGCIRQVVLETRFERHSGLDRKFIGVDGDVVKMPELPATN